KHGIDDAENSGGRADANRRCEDGDGGKAGRFAQRARGIANVLAEVVPPQPSARFVEAFLGPGHVAETAVRREPRVPLAQALFLESLGLQLEMGLDFRREVVQLASAPEHGPSSSNPPVPGSVRWPPKGASTASSP